MDSVFSILLFAALFYLMMRFGCGSHMMGGREHGGHSSTPPSSKATPPIDPGRRL